MTTLERLVLLAVIIFPGITLAVPAAGHYFERRDCIAQFSRDVEKAAYGLIAPPSPDRCLPRLPS